MHGTGDGRYDPDTVLLPAGPPADSRPLPPAGLPVVPADATVLLPAFQGGPAYPVVDGDAPTQVLPVITDAPRPPGAPPAGDELAEGAESVTRNSAVMAVGSLVSRITGFIRTAALAAALGAAFVADDYN